MYWNLIFMKRKSPHPSLAFQIALIWRKASKCHVLILVLTSPPVALEWTNAAFWGATSRPECLRMILLKFLGVWIVANYHCDLLIVARLFLLSKTKRHRPGKTHIFIIWSYLLYFILRLYMSCLMVHWRCSMGIVHFLSQISLIWCIVTFFNICDYLPWLGRGQHVRVVYRFLLRRRRSWWWSLHLGCRLLFAASHWSCLSLRGWNLRIQSASKCFKTRFLLQPVGREVSTPGFSVSVRCFTCCFTSRRVRPSSVTNSHRDSIDTQICEATFQNVAHKAM